MSDDIVTRLRDYLAIVDHAFVWNELSDAADEIERLRKTNDVLRNDLIELMQIIRESTPWLPSDMVQEHAQRIQALPDGFS